MVKRILTEEQQILKDAIYKSNKIISVCYGLNNCDLLTLKLLYTYLFNINDKFYNLLKSRPNFYKDIDQTQENIKYEMEKLTNDNLNELIQIIKINNKIDKKISNIKPILIHFNNFYILDD